MLLEYAKVCPQGFPAPVPGHPAREDSLESFPFRTGPAAELTASAPTVSYAGRNVEGDLALTRVKVRSMNPATAHLTDTFVTVGGERGVGGEERSVGIDGMIALPSSCVDPELATVNSCIGTTVFGEGAYQVSARFSVVGVGELSSESLAVTLACEDGCALGPRPLRRSDALPFALLGLALVRRRRSRVPPP